MEERNLHYNVPQIKSALVGAPTEIVIHGRATGKTEGIGANKVSSCYFNQMPRGNGAIVGLSFNQLFTRTLPGLKRGFEMLGYYEGEHFLIGKTPTDKWKRRWNWEGPYYRPDDYSQTLVWWNGAVAQFISQDRPFASNGPSYSWIYGDEAKTLKADRLKTELFPANRGFIPAFKNNPYHHGITFTTDMPVGTAGWWLFDYEEAMDRQRVKDILSLQKIIYDLRTRNLKSAQRKAAKKVIEAIEHEINELRKGLIFFYEASTLWNAHMLGADWFLNELINQGQFNFKTQILNIRPVQLENGFYVDLDEEKHGYVNFDNSFLDSLNYDFTLINSMDCRRDADLNRYAPLHITLDYNKRFWPVVTAQPHLGQVNELRIINAQYVEFPKKLNDTLDQWIDYYRFHNNKVVYYWYDHTAVSEQRATTMAEDVVDRLTAAGWTVIRRYIGRASTHEHRYNLYGHILRETGQYNWIMRFNRDNCSQLLISMFRTQTEQKKNGFGKDKRPELDPNYPAKDAPHFGEALDTLVDGIMTSSLSFSDKHVSSGIDVLD